MVAELRTHAVKLIDGEPPDSSKDTSVGVYTMEMYCGLLENRRRWQLVVEFRNVKHLLDESRRGEMCHRCRTAVAVMLAFGKVEFLDRINLLPMYQEPGDG